MIRVAHPTGNPFVRALLQALVRESVDLEFWTTIAVDPAGVSGWIPRSLKGQMQRRAFDLPKKSIKTRPWREWVRLLAPSLGMSSLVRHERGWASVDSVYRDLDRRVARQLRATGRRGDNDWVYGYEDGASVTFEAAEELGIGRAYELPIAHWRTTRRLLAEEAERWPTWAATLASPADSDEKLQRKSRELELADVVVVPSEFVRRSLPEGTEKGKRVVVAEFGTPQNIEGETIHRERGSRLRVLFAGSMSQRKGLADLFGAMKLLQRSDVELVIMGSPMAPMAFYRSQGVPFIYESPRPHREVLQLMRSCDVLVLPSIVEGRALVQQEAMACGLPVVSTANAGCEDLVIDGETGFLVPIRCPDVLADRIDRLASNRLEVVEMGREARRRSALLSWERYGDGILESLGLAKTFQNSVNF